MDAGEARHLKHELRTPINHIVGYSALLLESAQDSGDTALAAQAMDINSSANELTKTVEKVLVSSQGSLDHANIWGMKQSVVPLVNELWSMLEAPLRTCESSSYKEDLYKIRGATERLQALLARVASPGND